MMLHRSIADRIAVGMLGSCLLLACARTNASQGPATTIIIVRHGERASLASLDPPLLEAGEVRARDLAVALRDAGVQAIITTQFVRTKATAAPLARAIGVQPEVIPDSGASHARDVANAIRDRHTGQTVLVVAHGHTIPAIIAALGAPMPQRICETMFDQLFVVTASPAGSAHVIRTRYGAASTPDSSCAPMRRAP